MHITELNQNEIAAVTGGVGILATSLIVFAGATVVGYAFDKLGYSTSSIVEFELQTLLIAGFAILDNKNKTTPLRRTTKWSIMAAGLFGFRVLGEKIYDSLFG